MNKKQAINVSIPVIYNMLFYDKCTEILRACTAERFICLSNKQAGILRRCLCADDLMDIELNGEEECFVNVCTITDGVPTDWICDLKTDGKQFFYRKITMVDSQEWIKISSTNILKPEELFRIVQNCAIIRALNIQNEVNSRNTLLHLCVYSNEPETYIEIFFRTLICKIIKFFQTESDKDNKEQFLELIQYFFDRINQLQEPRFRNGTMDIICESMEKYIDKMREKAVFMERNMANGMQRGLTAYNQKKNNKNRSVFWDIKEHEKVRFERLYRIVRRLLELEGFETNKFPQIDFCMESDREDNYIAVIEILDSIKNDMPKKKKVLIELYNAFWYDVEIADETIEEMKKYVQ